MRIDVVDYRQHVPRVDPTVRRYVEEDGRDLDGDIIEIAGGQEPLRVGAGPHDLEITSNDFQTFSRSFTVKRGATETMRISLVPKRTTSGEGGPPREFPGEASPHAGRREMAAIFFAREKSGTRDLFLANPDGTGLVNLTEGAIKSSAYPRISPDGARIAAVTSGDRILIYDVRTGTKRCFKPNGVGDINIVFWLSDEELLYQPATLDEVWRCTADGTQIRECLTWGRDSWPGPPALLKRVSRDRKLLGGDAQKGFWAATSDVFLLNNVAEPVPGDLRWVYREPNADSPAPIRFSRPRPKANSAW